jgi:hypothetical protein
MTSLVAIARATRASALALATCQCLVREIDEATRNNPGARFPMYRKLRAAQRRYQAAQAILSANPLPGDR